MENRAWLYLVHTTELTDTILDEFEKTNYDVQQTLLNAFESGEWRDKRASGSSGLIDCSKVVWVSKRLISI